MNLEEAIALVEDRACGKAVKYAIRVGLEIDDAVQAARLGIVAAYRNYDPNRGPFENASWGYVESELRQLAASKHPVTINSQAITRYYSVMKAAKWDIRVAETLLKGRDFTRNTLYDVHTALGYTRSLNEVIGEGDSETTLGDCVEAQASSPLAEQPNPLPARLSDRYRDILESAYGIGRPAQTDAEIAERLNVTHNYANTIKLRALKRAKALLEAP